MCVLKSVLNHTGVQTQTCQYLVTYLLMLAVNTFAARTQLVFLFEPAITRLFSIKYQGESMTQAGEALEKALAGRAVGDNGASFGAPLLVGHLTIRP